MRAPAFKKLGGLKGDRLSRMPRGFDKEHPAADLLQQKQFLGAREEAAEFATSPAFYKELLATFAALVPLCRFLNEPLDRARAKRDPSRYSSDIRRLRAITQIRPDHSGRQMRRRSRAHRMIARSRHRQPFRRAIKKSTAPAASAAAPASSCCEVAPARMPSATIDARIGHHRAERRGELRRAHDVSSGARRRRTSVAVHTARYITSRATALTAANCTNDPVSASVSATAAVNRIAFDGV